MHRVNFGAGEPIKSGGDTPKSDSSLSTQSVSRKPARVDCKDWNLHISSNITMLDRQHVDLLPPHPAIETLRRKKFEELKGMFDENGKITTDFESILILRRVEEGVVKRFLMDMNCHSANYDGLFYSGSSEENKDHPQSSALTEDLTACFPMRFNLSNDTSVLFQTITAYASTVQSYMKYPNLIQHCNDNPAVAHNAKIALEQCEKAVDNAQKAKTEYDKESITTAAFLKELQVTLLSLDYKCQYLRDFVREDIGFACDDLAFASHAAAVEIRSKHAALLESHGILVSWFEQQPQTPPLPEEVPSCALLLRFPTPLLPNGKWHEDHSINLISITVEGQSDSMQLKPEFFYKMEDLYHYHAYDDRSFQLFLSRLWCMLMRYKTVSKANESDGADFDEVSLPVSVFRVLSDFLNVTFECFSSPLNSYFKQYCSLFPDTDTVDIRI